jgi:nifR3 family TIM-barrel protein
VSFFAHALARGGAVLAPMAGFSDAPFRRLCRRYGSAWAVTEMVSARALALGDERGIAIGAPYPGEPDLVIQLFASDPSEAAIAAERLQRRYRPSAFDLNMGCPVKKIVHRGCGVELMADPERAGAIVAAVRAATGLPVSVKLRLGRDRVTVDASADAVVAGGAALVAVHGRTGAQKYAGEADWEPIARLARRLPVPVVGSGDVTDATGFRARRALGVGVMIARGALGRPWLFAEVRGEPAPTWPEAARVVVEHAQAQAAWYGEARGLRSLRGHLAHYVAPFPEAADLRDRLVRVDTVADVVRTLAPRLPKGALDDVLEPPDTRATMRHSSAPADGGGLRV